jgi:multiple sugar transport system permease protein/raffinose/stachyose/melibiose transport system permease protein
MAAHISERTRGPSRAWSFAAGRLSGGNWPEIAVFLTPALIVYAVFTAYPVVRTFLNSFYEIAPGGDTFVGLKHYYELIFADEVFLRSVINTFIWAIVGPIVDVGLGLILALVIYSGVRLGGVYRFIWFAPVLISNVVAGILWLWIYNYDWGVVNSFLRVAGLEALTASWLGDTSTALAAVIVAHSWKWAGFDMVVCLAALYALPTEVIDAAELDNCGWFAKTIYVIVPMIRRTLLNLTILAFIGRMKIFDLVWVMTRGGPLWSTETVSTYAYKRAFNWNTFDLGFPSAIGALWSIVIIGFVVLLTWLFKPRDRLEY